LWAKGLNAKDIHKEMFPVYGGKCLSRKAAPLPPGNKPFALKIKNNNNWVEKFSQGRFESHR
jgi:hypothetical protein